MCSGTTVPGYKKKAGKGNRGTTDNPAARGQESGIGSTRPRPSALPADRRIGLEARFDRAQDARELARVALQAARLRAAQEVHHLALEHHRVARVGEPSRMVGELVLLEVLLAVGFAARFAALVGI